MSLIKANAVQVGQSPTATQNFTLAVPPSPDGTIKLARGNSGATTQDVLSVDASGNINGLVKSTGSTTARSLANRFADVVNVRDFGDVDGIGDVTLSVPSQYPTIQDAFTYLATKRINSGTTVKIQVADGTYTLTSAINANHPDGSQIQLLGNQTTAANCVLQVVGQSTFDAIVVSSRNVLGFLNGFRIRSTVKALLANNSTGVLAVQNATIICGTKIEVDNFYYGIASRDGSYIYCPSAVVTNAGDVGIWAFCGSTIVANNATSNYASDVANSWGYGFEAEFGSTLVATGASATGCLIAGIASLSNSICRTHNATCNANIGSGFYSLSGGQIECYGSSSTNNQRYGLEINEYANIIGVSTNTGNTLGAANSFAFVGGIGNQGRIASSVGALRVDAGDTSSVYFNNSNGLQFEVKGPFLTTVNRIQASGNSAGQAPFFVAEGNDSIIDFGIFPKGNGSYIQLGAGHFTQADSPTTGYIQVKDNTGVIRKLAVIA